MDSRRVVSIGWSCPFKEVDLLSTTYLPEFDTIIWSPAAFLFRLLANQPYASMRNIARAKERLNELDKWVSDGHALIVIATPLVPINFEASNVPFNLAQMSPLKFVGLTGATGHLIESCGPKQVNEVLERIRSVLTYQAVLKGAQLRGLMRIHLAQTGPEQLVAGYQGHGRGIIIFVPPLRDQNFANIYGPILASLPELLTGKDDISPPEWVNILRTAQEAKAYDVIKSAMVEIDARNAEIAEQKVAIANAARLKELFFATGEQFENAVASAFRELGLQVVDGPRTRADLISFDGTMVAAIETKGLEGIGKESDLRQVETWRAEVQHTLAATASERKSNAILYSYIDPLEKVGLTLGDGLDIECKGIMVIGTFRNTPLSDRNEADFPDNVLTVC